MPGLDCLSDEQVLPLLLAMDSETLLRVGKSSPRLYSLVCDRQVWRHLLKEVVHLGKKQVKELAAFGLGLFGISGSPGMMSEVLKEAARRFVFLAGAVKLTIAIPSWGGGDDFEVFEVDALYLDELVCVAESVGTKFILKGTQTPLIDYCINNIDNKDKFIQVGRVLLCWFNMVAPLKEFYRDNIDKIYKDPYLEMLDMVVKAYKKALHLLHHVRLNSE